MRKAKIIAVVAAAAILLAVVAAWLLLDANRYRDEIESRLEAQLQRQVSLGNMRLGLLPVRFTVENLEIAEDPAFRSALPFTKTERVDVGVRLLPLIGGSVEIDSVELVRPSVELIRNQAGAWNFASLGPPKEAAKTEEAKPPVAEEPGKGFKLNRLTITDGAIGYTDGKKPRAVYDHIDFTLTDFAPGSPFSFDVTAHLPGADSQQIRIAGTGGPLPEAGPASMPMEATVTLQDIGISGLRAFLDSEGLKNAEGTLSGETRIESKSGKLSGKGKVSLTGGRVAGIDVGYPLDLDFDLSSEVAKGILQITTATVKLGPTPLSLTGTIDTNPTPMAIDLRLQTPDASIAEAARLASAFGVAFSPGTTVTGRLMADVRARGPMDRPALSGTVSGRDLQVSGKELPQPVQVAALDISLTPTEIRSNEFEARTGKTAVKGRFALRDYMAKSPAVDVALRAPGATLPEMQTIAKAYGLTGADQLTGAGMLDFDLRAAGPLESVATANVMRALNGNINLNFDALKIQGFDAMGEVGRIGGFQKAGGTNKGFTEVLTLTGHIAVKNGVAQTNDLVAKLADATFAAAGSSDLADETLQLRATAVFSKAFSEKMGGSGVGGFLTTALSNAQGELVIPVVISGSFDKPKFAPDAQAFLRLQQQRLLPGLDNPRAALSSILGGLTGQKKPEGTEQPLQEEKKPANTLKGVLEGILGGRK